MTRHPSGMVKPGRRKGIILVIVIILLVVVIMIATAFGMFVFDERRGSARVLDSVQGDAAMVSGMEHAVRVIDFVTEQCSPNADNGYIAVISAPFDSDSGLPDRPPELTDYSQDHWPSLFTMDNDGNPIWYQNPDSPAADDYRDTLAWQRGISQYFRPYGVGPDPNDYTRMLDTDISPYNPYGLDTTQLDADPPAYAGRWFTVRLGENDGEMQPFNDIQSVLRFKLSDTTLYPYTRDLNENGDERGRYAVLVFELDGALHPRVGFWHGADPSDSANPMFSSAADYQLVFDELAGSDDYSPEYWDDIDYPNVSYISDSMRLFDPLIPGLNAYAGSINGYPDLWHALYPPTVSFISSSDKLAYNRQKNSVRGLLRPYPSERELAGGVRPRLNINIASWGAIRAALARVEPDIEGDDATRRTKLDRLVNAIIACRPFFSRVDFEEFLAAQLDQDEYDRVKKLAAHRVIDAQDMKIILYDGGLTGDFGELSDAPSGVESAYTGKRMQYFRDTSGADSAAISESDFNAMLNATGASNDSFFTAGSDTITWTNANSGITYTVDQLDLAATIFTLAQPPQTPPFLDLDDDGWSWRLQLSRTGAYQFNLNYIVPGFDDTPILSTTGGAAPSNDYRTQDVTPAMEFKFRSRYYYILVVGQAIRHHGDMLEPDVDPETAAMVPRPLEVLNTARQEAVYDAKEHRILYQRLLVSDKASLWDPVP